MSELIYKEKEQENRHKLKPAVLKVILLLVVIFYAAFLLVKCLSVWFGPRNTGKETLVQPLPDGTEIRLQYLTLNRFSRPGTALKRVNGIVVHYTANPGTSAENNRSYFEGLKQTKLTYASSHFIIGLDGEILQCIPLNEISYASNNRNKDTISIECCHADETGVFNEATYHSLVILTAALCTEFNLEEKDIIRHYDVNKKLCPLYYVEHEDVWEAFKDDVMKEADTQKKQKQSSNNTQG